MRLPGQWPRSTIAACLVLLLALPCSATAQTQQAPAVQTPQQTSGGDAAPQAATAPSGVPAEPPARPILPVNDGTQSTAPASTAPDTTPKAPVGTAAAPYEKGIGVAASRPAGAVIAPAKQRRTRTILIRVAVIIAAAVAVGTVVGLSSGSPSTSH